MHFVETLSLPPPYTQESHNNRGPLKYLETKIQCYVSLYMSIMWDYIDKLINQNGKIMAKQWEIKYTL